MVLNDLEAIDACIMDHEVVEFVVTFGTADYDDRVRKTDQ
jgi:hypothetical protein